MTVLRFWVPGHVPSKSNTRMSKRPGEKAKRDAVKVYEARVKSLATKARKQAVTRGEGPFPLDGPREVRLVGHRQIADPDNWLKATLDAMEGVCYRKDNQVVEGSWKDLGRGETEEHGILILVRWM